MCPSGIEPPYTVLQTVANPSQLQTHKKNTPGAGKLLADEGNTELGVVLTVVLALMSLQFFETTLFRYSLFREAGFVLAENM